MDITLRDWQAKSVDMLRANIAAGIKAQILCAPTAAGKCLGRGTPVLMADGSVRKVERILPGHLLMGDDGTPRRVRSITRGREQLFRVTPKKGDPYVVNASHLLSLKKTPGSDGLILADGSKIARDADVVAVRADVFHASNATARHCLKGWRMDGVQEFHGRTFDDGDYLLPPYILGAWLGDGSMGKAAISKPWCNMVREWCDYGQSIGLSVRQSGGPGECPTWHLSKGPDNRSGKNAVEIAVLGQAWRHIPDAYKYGTAEVRRELLAGLIDSDGHITHKGCDWISKSKELADDFAFVCRSLGLSCYLSEQTKGIKATGFTGQYWRASVSGDLSMIPMRDKIADPRKSKKRHRVHGLTLEPIGEGDYFGFDISGNRLFCLGDFTVTHNTLLSAHMIQAAVAKGKRAVFLVDMTALVDQTSRVFDAYGIDHGIIQADHPRYRPYLPVQVCSAQTLARRGWPECDVMFVDEAHGARKSTWEHVSKRETVVIGLTATPFTKGLGKIYDAIVNVTTTDQLTEAGILAPFRAFAPSAPNMAGVKVVAGEWEAAETSKRCLEVVGDVVAEYQKLGGGQKFICSAVDTNHVRELQRQFLSAGINAAEYTYTVKDEERAEVVAEFRKPDSLVRGLITVTAASRGFDVPDVGVVIMARPLRNSFAEHIQFLGRGLRTAPGKTEAIVLDHAGNMSRFWTRMQSLFADGWHELDDGKPKEKPDKPEKQPPEPMQCGVCKYVHAPKPACPNCGHEYPKASSRIEHRAGTLTELIKRGDRPAITREIWPQVCGYARERRADPTLARKYALAIYRDMTGDWPTRHFEDTDPRPPSPEVVRKIRAAQIRHAYRRSA